MFKAPFSFDGRIRRIECIRDRNTSCQALLVV